MLSKLFYLAAVILFIVLAVANSVNHDFVYWGAAAIAAGLLVEGVTPPSLR